MSARNSTWRFLVDHKAEPLIIIGLFVAFALCTGLPTCRVGDGCEYYAMFLSWAKSSRPFMTDVDWANYDALYRTGTIRGLMPVEVLRGAFPYLVRGETADFVHFWFYSLCAALNYRALSLLGLPVGPQTSFLLLHWELSCIVGLLAYRWFGKRGLGAVVALVVGSPLLWFVNKAHTEFFTFAVTLGAVICFLKSKNLASATFLALASTQNISFAPISALVLAFELGTRQRKLACSLLEGVLLIVIALALVIHPAYYFFRFGVIDPILASGAAAVGLHLEHFYIWFFDPDIGLFPNFPVAILLVTAALLPATREDRSDLAKRRNFVFAAVYVGISLLAQSSTTNLNSGATPSVARYALWYACLLFPVVLVAIRWASRLGRAWRTVLVLSAVLLCVVNATLNWPGRPPNHLRPTQLSRFVQTHLSFLYNPPAEVFAERFGGMGESLPRALLAVVGPDCKKVLVYTGDARRLILDANGCAFDSTELSRLLHARMSRTANAAKKSLYLTLDDAERESIALVCPPRLDLTSKNAETTPAFMLRGFGPAEPHGRWSIGSEGSLRCRLGPEDHYSTLRVQAHAFLANNREQRMAVSVASGAESATYRFSGNEPSRTVDIDLSRLDGRDLVVRFHFPDAVSPSSLGISDDHRRLAVGFASVEFRP